MGSGAVLVVIMRFTILSILRRNPNSKLKRSIGQATLSAIKSSTLFFAKIFDCIENPYIIKSFGFNAIINSVFEID